jgi:putative aldouronate transport system substrate-binding protein
MAFIIAGKWDKPGNTPSSGEERYKFSMMLPHDSPEAPKPDSDLMLYLKNELHADIDLTWIPKVGYNDKIAVQVAAADLPMIVGIRNPRSGLMISAIRDGLFWPIDKYLDNDSYPNLKKLNSITRGHLTIERQEWGLAWERKNTINGMFWRQDWMDKLGLEKPTNIDEVYEICKAFTERDPDGNGKADTTGLSIKGNTLGDYLSHVAIFYGGRHEWYWDEATQTIKNEIDHPAYQKSLDWFRNLYSRGYFIQNFVESNNERIPYEQGKAGLIMIGSVIDVPGIHRNLTRVFPEARTGFTQQMTTPEGKLALEVYIGHYGSLMFSRTSIKNEVDLDMIMRFYNEMCEDDNILALRRGYKDKHYSLENGVLTVSEAQAKQYNDDFVGSERILPLYVYKTVPEKMTDSLAQAVEESIDNYKGELYLNMANILVSETSINLGSTLTNILQDARMKYVLGQLDLTGWKAATAEWKSVGGDKVAAEYTEDYKKNFAQ